VSVGLEIAGAAARQRTTKRYRAPMIPVPVWAGY
jgi:hypothetical protein